MGFGQHNVIWKQKIVTQMNPFHISILWSKIQWAPTFLAPGTSFGEDDFSMDQGREIISGWFKGITNIVHFIYVIITQAPP